MKTYNTTPLIKKLLNTRKRTFIAQAIESDKSRAIFDTSSYWSGGSKESYEVVDVLLKHIEYPPTGSYPNFKADYILIPGRILINSGTFMGKPASVKLYYFSQDKPALESVLGITLD